MIPNPSLLEIRNLILELKAKLDQLSPQPNPTVGELHSDIELLKSAIELYRSHMPVDELLLKDALRERDAAQARCLKYARIVSFALTRLSAIATQDYRGNRCSCAAMAETASKDIRFALKNLQE